MPSKKQRAKKKKKERELKRRNSGSGSIPSPSLKEKKAQLDTPLPPDTPPPPSSQRPKVKKNEKEEAQAQEIATNVEIVVDDDKSTTKQLNDASRMSPLQKSVKVKDRVQSEIASYPAELQKEFATAPNSYQLSGHKKIEAPKLYVNTSIEERMKTHLDSYPPELRAVFEKSHITSAEDTSIRRVNALQKDTVVNMVSAERESTVQSKGSKNFLGMIRSMLIFLNFIGGVGVVVYSFVTLDTEMREVALAAVVLMILLHFLLTWGLPSKFKE